MEIKIKMKPKINRPLVKTTMTMTMPMPMAKAAGLWPQSIVSTCAAHTQVTATTHPI